MSGNFGRFRTFQKNRRGGWVGSAINFKVKKNIYLLKAYLLYMTATIHWPLCAPLPLGSKDDQNLPRPSSFWKTQFLWEALWNFGRRWQNIGAQRSYFSCELWRTLEGDFPFTGGLLRPGRPCACARGSSASSPKFSAPSLASCLWEQKSS